MDVACPDCRGEGHLPGFAGTTYLELACPRCKATGSVPKIQLTWAKKGNIIKLLRVKYYLGLTQAAKMLKIKPSELSLYERGAKNPKGIISCLKLKLKKINSQTS